MTATTLRLFGPGVLTADDAVVRLHSARTLGLLAFLVLEPGRRHARAALVDLLWPDLPETAGRQGLRQALYSIKTVAGGRLGGCLLIDPTSVQFNAPAASAIDIDVLRFLHAVHGASNAQWRAAAAIEPTPLLDGLATVPGQEFEAWLSAARERLRALALHNLGRLASGHMARGEWDEAAPFAQAMRDLDPNSEVASQFLLRISAARGRVFDLDAEWTRLCRCLSQGLSVGPSADTEALYRALRRDAAAQVPVAEWQPDRTGAMSNSAAGDAAHEAESMVWAGQAAERVFAFNQAADLYGRALRVMARNHAPPTPRRIDLLLRQEAMLERLGRRADQVAVIDEAMAIAQRLDDVARMALVGLRRAGVMAYQGRHADARAAAQCALGLFRDMRDTPGEAEALRELGFVHWHAENHAEALSRTREALDLHRRIGDVTGEATALHNLAEIHRSLGSPRQAGQWFEQAIRLHWVSRNPVGEILSLFGWAQALRQMGDLSGANDKLQAALELSAGSGERVMHSRVLHALSMQHAAQGAPQAAFDFIHRAIAVDRAIGYSHALGHDLVDLANLHLAQRELAQARVALREAQM